MAIAPSRRRVVPRAPTSVSRTAHERRIVERAQRPPPEERPLWQLVLLLYAVIAALVIVVTALAFAAAHALA